MIRRSLFPVLLATGLVPGLVMAQAKPPVAPIVPAPATTAPAVPALSMPAKPLVTASVTNEGEGTVPTDLDATAVREAAHLKTQIDLEKLRTELQNQQQTRASAKKKFDDELTGKTDKDGKPSATSASALPPIVHVRPYASSIYVFGERSYAQVVIDGATFLAVPGKSLPNGDKVISIGDNGVVLNQHGRRVTVPVQSGAMLPSAALP